MLDRLFDHDDLNYEVELPEDASQWTEQINSILFTKHPELVNYPAKLMLDKFEPQKLYAKGSYVFEINEDKLIVPVVVKSKKLQPFDIAMVNDRWEYLTPELISELIHGSMSLGESMSNKDSVDFYSQAFENDVPYGNYDRNIRTITASVINSNQKSALAKRVLGDSAIKQACENNAAFNNVISNVLSDEHINSRKYKSAFVTRDGFLNGHIYITDLSGKRDKISTSFAAAKRFVKTHMPEKYVDFIKTGSVSLLADDFMSDGQIISGDSGVGGMLSKLMRKVTGPGMASFMSGSGSKPLLVIKIKRVSEPMPGNSDLLGLGEKGDIFDISDKDAGPCSDSADGILNSLSKIDADELKSGDSVMPEFSNNYLEPITVQQVISLPIGKAIIGKTKQSKDLFVGIILSKYDQTKTASDCSAMLPKHAKPIILPNNAKFVKVSSDHGIDLYENTKQCLAAACQDHDLIKILPRDRNTVAIKTADESIFCDRVSVPYFLNSLGVPINAIAKIAEQIVHDQAATAAVPKKTKLKISKGLKDKVSSVNWIKVATFMESEESVDSALALDYLDDESVSEFYSKVPAYKNTVSELAKLLISIRLGSDIVEEETVRNAIEAMSELVKEITMNRAGA